MKFSSVEKKICILPPALWDLVQKGKREDLKLENIHESLDEQKKAQNWVRAPGPEKALVLCIT